MAENPGVTDEQATVKWQEMAPLLDRMIERVGSRGEFPIQPGSVLADDDVASSPYQVSHAVRMCLNAAVDHLHAVKVLVVDAAVLHLAAPSSLARGALENLSAAFWILHPDERDVRVERCLRWQAVNMKDGERATSAMGASPERKSLETKLQQLVRVGAAIGIPAKTIRGGYSSTEAVAYANDHAAAGAVLFNWQLCSGFAHGRPWAYLGSLTRETSASDEPGVQHLRLTSSQALALFGPLTSMHLLQSFLRLYQARSNAPVL
jgi:hypothetical protein